MPDYDLVVKNGDVVFSDGTVTKAHIGVKDGVIAAFSSSKLAGRNEIDANNLTVFPGVIDQHFHVFVGFGWETWENATRAAARGGITTVIKMPLDKPPTITVQELHKSRARAKKDAYIDHAFLGGFVPDDPEELGKQAEAGVVGYKLFQDHTAPPGMYPGLNSGQQYDAFVRIAKLGLTATVHSEDPFLIDVLSERLRKAGHNNPDVWEDARPPVSELLGILRTVLLAKEARCRTVVAHVSIPTGVNAVSEAREEGYDVYAETCPHYLLLTKDHLAQDARLKYNPPSREREAVEMMWKLLAQGYVHSIGSDHAPLKKNKSASIWDMAPGAGNAVEVMLPLIATEALFNRGLTISRIAEVLASNPAKIFGLYPKKGCLGIGSDADMVLLDLKAEERVNSQTLCYTDEQGKWSPYENWAVRVIPRMTILRGEVIMRDGEMLVRPGFGQPLTAVRS
jgi:allantoinase